MHVRMHAHTHTHTCAGADTRPDPELHNMAPLFHLNYHGQKPNRPQRLLFSLYLFIVCHVVGSDGLSTNCFQSNVLTAATGPGISLFD